MGHVRAAGVSMGLGVQTDCATPALARFGSHDLKEKYLVPALRGDQVCCVGVSEPSGGSDVSAVQTRAVRDGGEWVINGQKMWITNSLQVQLRQCPLKSMAFIMYDVQFRPTGCAPWSTRMTARSTTTSR